jgi:hypothetical protein
VQRRSGGDQHRDAIVGANRPAITYRGSDRAEPATGGADHSAHRLSDWRADADGHTNSSDPPARVAATTRTVSSDGTRAGLLEAALHALLDGPTADEGRLGMTSAINPRASVLGVHIRNGEVVVDVSSAFGRGGSRSEDQLAVAQVVFTATAVEGVERVTFAVDGSAVETITSHDLPAIDLTRGDMAGARPAILVESPAPFATIRSGAHVVGEAATDDGRLRYRLLDRNDVVLAEGRSRISAGAGEWGSFDLRLRFEVAADQRATLIVFAGLDANGDPVDAVELPVRLAG